MDAKHQEWLLRQHDSEYIAARLAALQEHARTVHQEMAGKAEGLRQALGNATAAMVRWLCRMLTVLLPAAGCCWHTVLLLAAAGCWLLAAGCWLLAAGCWLLAAVGVWFCASQPGCAAGAVE